MENFKADADTMNAFVSGMGAVVFALVRQLEPAKQVAFANDLAALAKRAEADGETTVETLLLDLHKAATMAR